MGKMKEEYIRTSIPILGMTCYACALSIEEALNKVDGVKEARVNFLMKKVIIDHDPDKADISCLEETIERAGYKVAYKKYDGVLSRLFGKKKK